jgi:hypothetical protein
MWQSARKLRKGGPLGDAGPSPAGKREEWNWLSIDFEAHRYGKKRVDNYVKSTMGKCVFTKMTLGKSRFIKRQMGKTWDLEQGIESIVIV